MIIAEAQRRGIPVHIEDDKLGWFVLGQSTQAVRCWESLTERTSALTFVTCSDKRLTHRRLAAAGLRVPRQVSVADPDQAATFLAECGSVVVKPAVGGEQGRGITVDVRSADELTAALSFAGFPDQPVLLEEYVAGRDVRVIVIDHRFVAAIERIPAHIVGDGHHSLRNLITEQNKQLAASSEGECQIPLDAETERVIHRFGYTWDSILPAGQSLQVRKTANFHTGGSIRDVTAQISSVVRTACEHASRVLDIGVVGLDLLVPAIGGDDYVFIEANERPGLANHEPQPVVERFIDYLFPESSSASTAL